MRLLLAAIMFTGACAATTPRVPVAPIKSDPIAKHDPIAKPDPTLDRAAIRAKLAARRDATIANFLAYRDAGQYPLNELPNGGVRHVWIDNAGNLCAAATLLSKDWGRDAAIEVGKRLGVETKLADAKGDVAAWIMTTGLTHHEIVAIQAPMVELSPSEQMRMAEISRLYNLYSDVLRQLTDLREESLDQATDALVRRPDLARDVLADRGVVHRAATSG